MLGYVGTINSTELASTASQGYQAGDAFGQSGLEYQYESELRGTPGRQELEVDSTGPGGRDAEDHPGGPGDNVVTNIDTNLQQVADNALATQILAPAQRPSTRRATTTPGATRRPPAGRWS